MAIRLIEEERPSDPYFGEGVTRVALACDHCGGEIMHEQDALVAWPGYKDGDESPVPSLVHKGKCWRTIRAQAPEGVQDIELRDVLEDWVTLLRKEGRSEIHRLMRLR